MPRSVHVHCCVFAAAGMIYFQILTQIVAELSGNMMLWGAVGSGFYLGGSGIGILLSQRSWKIPLQLVVAKIEALSALVGFVCVSFINVWHMIYRIYFFDSGLNTEISSIHPIIYFGGGAQLLSTSLGVLSGLGFGLLNQMAYATGLEKVQRVLALFQAGGLLGTLLTIGYLLPRFQPTTIACGTCIIHLGTVIDWQLSWAKINKLPSHIIHCLLGFACAVITLVSSVSYLDLEQMQRKNFYYNQVRWRGLNQLAGINAHPYDLVTWIKKADEYPEIDRHRGPYQAIEFVTDVATTIGPERLLALQPDPGNRLSQLASPPTMEWTRHDYALDSWRLHMDGHFEASSVNEAEYHQALAHIPTAILGSVQGKALIVGGGDGLLARELLRYGNKLENITLIDIDSRIVKLAQESPRLTELNHQSLLNPKVTIKINDAFQALRLTKDRYDKIYLDGLFPFNFETSRLYTVEFFNLLKRHLAPNGHVALLSPVQFKSTEQSEELAVLSLIASTLRAAGFAGLYSVAAGANDFIVATTEQLPAARLKDWKNSSYILDYLTARHTNKRPSTTQNAILTVEAVEIGTGDILPMASKTSDVNLDEVEVKSISDSLCSGAVNSLLRPKFFGRRDTNL